jgi:hypothetical protein
VHDFLERRDCDGIAGCGGIDVQDDWEGLGSLANKASHGHGGVVSSAPEFFAVVDKLDSMVVVGNNNDAVGVLGNGVDLLIFGFSTAVASTKVPKFLFA